MRLLYRLWRRLAGTLAGSRDEVALAEEIESHLQMQTDDNVRLGMSPGEARRAAVLKFGGVESIKESYRDQRGLPLLDSFGKDVRYAVRGMRRNPGFASVVILLIALGIGGATSVFGIVNALLLRPLPYAQPDRLVTVTLTAPTFLKLGFPDIGVSGPVFESLGRGAHSLERSALFRDLSFSLTGEGEPERVAGARVSADLFSLLGVRPQLGRSFTREEDQPGRQAVVLIGDALWTRRFARDPHVLGGKVLLNGKPNTVIGVMPPGFQFPSGPESPYYSPASAPAEIWRPLALAEWERTDIGSMNFSMISRLREGYSPTQAREELSAMAGRLAREHNAGAGWSVNVRRLQDAITRNIRPAILILFGAVVIVLLIACANVASLLFSRGLNRRPEIALRLALGAGPRRLVRQLLTESLALAGLAAAVAILISKAGLQGLIAVAPARIPGMGSAVIDVHVLAFAVAAAVLTALLFGLAPALDAVRRGMTDAVQGGGRVTSPAPSRTRSALLVSQFALLALLLVCSVLLAKSFVAVMRTPLGFRADDILTMRLAMPSRYDHSRRVAQIDRLVTGCATVSGVTAVAAVSTLPLTGEAEGRAVVAEDNRNVVIAKQPLFRYRAITPAYFRTLGIRLKGGREFTAGDGTQVPVAILTDSAARRLWPGAPDPIGRRLRSGDGQWLSVVGIVEDTRASGLDTEIRPYLYLPFRDAETFGSPEEFALVVRSPGEPADLAPALRSVARRIDQDLPITHIATMRQRVTDSVSPRRFPAVLMGAFAAFAVLLAAVGVYGVVSYSVARRTHEIGIRIALGASRRDVLTGVVKPAVSLALVGTTVGLAGAFVLTPFLRSLLYEVSPSDFSTYAASALLVIGVAAAAALRPAYRAARLDPVMCLRHE